MTETKASKVKLFNQGQRTIQVKGGEIKPQQIAELDKEDADRLKALYGGELVDEKDRVAVFSDTKDADAKTKADANKK